MRDRNGVGHSSSERGSTQGLALDDISVGNAVHRKLRSREITMRRQVGDTQSMINEEPSIEGPEGFGRQGRGAGWLE